MAVDESTTIAELKAARASLASAYAQICANPRPTYTTEEGRTIQWDTHRRSLLEEMERLDALIRDSEGPWMEQYEGILA